MKTFHLCDMRPDHLLRQPRLRALRLHARVSCRGHDIACPGAGGRGALEDRAGRGRLPLLRQTPRRMSATGCCWLTARTPSARPAATTASCPPRTRRGWSAGGVSAQPSAISSIPSCAGSCRTRRARTDPAGGLVFDFLADELDAGGNVVQAAMTGHEDGLVSLRAAEADDEVREGVRVSMDEPYRTLLGHFRHEIGHFYWTRLIREEATLEEARRLFGDERAGLRRRPPAQLRTGAAPPTGRNISSAPMPAATRRKISPSAGHISSTSSIRWKPPAPSASTPIRRATRSWRPRSPSIPTVPRMPVASSKPGSRSASP